MSRAHSANSVQARKKTSRTENTELSYETRTIIVVLLLLFIYPAGLVFMWAWMGNWPVWLKLIITIPLLLAVLAFFAVMILIGAVVSHVHTNGTRGQWYPSQMQITTTPMPTLPVTMTPAQTTSY